MKKIALSLLALIVILGFTFGCASRYTPAPGPDTSPATTESPTVSAPSPTPESPSPPTSTQGELKVHFIDVGQGDAALLQGPDFTILIDAGRHDRSDVVPYLKSAGVKSINLLIGTHPHADHIGQFPQVIEAFPVGEVWLSGDTTTTRTFERAIDVIEASDAGYCCCPAIMSV